MHNGAARSVVTRQARFSNRNLLYHVDRGRSRRRNAPRRRAIKDNISVCGPLSIEIVVYRVERDGGSMRDGRKRTE